MQIKISGLKEVSDRLQEMDSKASKTIVRKGLRAGAKVFLDTARANAPDKTGALKKNIKIRSLRTRQKVIRLMIGISKKWFTGPTFYGAFQEWGFHIGKRALGDQRKKVEGKHFIEKAYQQKKAEAVQAAEKVMVDEILKAAEGKGE